MYCYWLHQEFICLQVPLTDSTVQLAIERLMMMVNVSEFFSLSPSLPPFFPLFSLLSSSCCVLFLSQHTFTLPIVSLSFPSFSTLTHLFCTPQASGCHAIGLENLAIALTPQDVWSQGIFFHRTL